MYAKIPGKPPKNHLRILVLFTLLAALWLLLSGFFTPLQLAFGAASCAFTAWLSVRLGLQRSGFPRLAVTARYPRYLLWLTWQVVLSNLHVARVVLSPRIRLQRQVVRVKHTQKTALGVAIHANSITLTPGTLTMDADGVVLEVHALTRHVAEDVVDGEMDRRVTRLEGT